MSALLCGCDPEVPHACEEHAARAQQTAERIERFKERLTEDVPWPSADVALRAAVKEYMDYVTLVAERIGTGAAIPPPPSSLQRFADRLAAERDMAGTVPAASVTEATPLEESFIDIQRLLGTLAAEVSIAARRSEKLEAELTVASEQWAPDTRRVRVLEEENKRLNNACVSAGLSMMENQQAIQRACAENARIAAILATFYRAPLSMSSVQPLLDLAVEMNPSLAVKR
jgi:hypothetical protein